PVEHAHHAKPVELRHLQVQERDVRPLLFDQPDCGDTLRGFAHDLDVGPLAQRASQERPSRTLIVCDHGAQLIHDHAVAPAAACAASIAGSSSGSLTLAIAPSGSASSETDARSPSPSARPRSMFVRPIPPDPMSVSTEGSDPRAWSRTVSSSDVSPLEETMRRPDTVTVPPA